jgi:hypothetical protein
MQAKPSLVSVLDYYGVVYHPDRISQKIHCPVHEDAVSSCSINLDDEGWWKCFACGKAGDSLTLIMEKEEVDFAAALRFAEKIPGYGGDNVSGTNERRVPGLLGKTRPERRDGKQVRFRPSFNRDLGT